MFHDSLMVSDVECQGVSKPILYSNRRSGECCLLLISVLRAYSHNFSSQQLLPSTAQFLHCIPSGSGLSAYFTCFVSSIRPWTRLCPCRYRPYPPCLHPPLSVLIPHIYLTGDSLQIRFPSISLPRKRPFVSFISLLTT